MEGLVAEVALMRFLTGVRLPVGYQRAHTVERLLAHLADVRSFRRVYRPVL